MARSKAAALKQALKEQGRTTAWLARETGYSRSYVSGILNGRIFFTGEFQAKAIKAMGADGMVTDTFRGRVVQIPESIYRKAGDTTALVAVADAYEEAWKRAWLAEHGRDVLAVAVERAWQNAARVAS